MEAEQISTLTAMLPEKGSTVTCYFIQGGEKEGILCGYNFVGFCISEKINPRFYFVPWSTVRMLTWKEEG